MLEYLDRLVVAVSQLVALQKPPPNICHLQPLKCRSTGAEFGGLVRRPQIHGPRQGRMRHGERNGG